jgi:hypothetical protein
VRDDDEWNGIDDVGGLEFPLRTHPHFPFCSRNCDGDKMGVEAESEQRRECSGSIASLARARMKRPSDFTKARKLFARLGRTNLKKRYAKGEISKDEYEKTKTDIQ